MRKSRCGLPLFFGSYMLSGGGGTYDRRSNAINYTITFIRISFRIYRCICLNYSDYNFKKIKKQKHICNLPVRCVFTYSIGKPRLWFLHFLKLLYFNFSVLSNRIPKKDSIQENYHDKKT